MQEWRLDGAKLCFAWMSASRPRSRRCWPVLAAINDCNARGLPMFLEPLPVTKTDKGYVVVKTAAELGAPGRRGERARR